MDPRVGLCSACEHCRIVKSDRSMFYMCRRSMSQPEYPKYPELPVRRCAGFVPAAGRQGGGADDKLKA